MGSAGDPTNALLQSRAITTGNVLLALLIDAGLTERADAFRGLLLEIESGDEARIVSALGQTCTVFSSFTAEVGQLTDQLAHGFEISLGPSARVVGPGEPATYTVRLEGTGSESSTINLSFVGLPTGVAGQLGSRWLVAPVPSTRRKIPERGFGAT